MKTKTRSRVLWNDAPHWFDKPATKQQFLALARKRGVPVKRLCAAFGVEGETIEKVAAELSKWNYGWDKAMCVVEFIWAHLPYSEQKRS